MKYDIYSRLILRIGAWDVIQYVHLLVFVKINDGKNKPQIGKEGGERNRPESKTYLAVAYHIILILDVGKRSVFFFKSKTEKRSNFSN